MQDSVPLSNTSSELFDLSHYWLVLKRRVVPAALTFVSVLGIGVYQTLTKTEIYRSTGQLRFESSSSNANIIGLESANSDSYQDTNRILATEIINMQSTPILTEVLSRLSKSDPDLSVGDIGDGLNINPVEDTDVVSVSYEGTDPELAMQIVDQLMQVYVKSNLKNNNAASTYARQFITQQLPEVKRKVFLADSALRQFKEKYRITDFATAQTANATRQTEIQTLLDANASQIADLSEQMTQLTQKLQLSPQQALTLNDVAQSTVVQDTLKQLSEVDRNLVQAQATLSADHPAIAEFQAKKAELEGLLKRNVTQVLGSTNILPQSIQAGTTRQDLIDTFIKSELARQGLLRQRTVLSAQQVAYRDQAKYIPALEQRLRQLDRELKAAEGTYQSLLNKLQEVEVTENQTIPTVQVIEPASRPGAPIFPNHQVDLMRAVMAAAMFAGAMIYILEKLDRKLKSSDDIQLAYPYTVLGTIPEFKQEKHERNQLPALEKAFSQVNEAYRMLQANIKFVRCNDLPVQTLVVTSAIPGEGKSTTAANLAAALGQMGHQVLLIDADLRKPAQHQIWEVPNATGLTDTLSLPIDSPSNGTLPVHRVTDNVDLVTSGTMVPNPLLILDSQQTKHLIQSQTQNYNYIIIDSPPLSVVGDARVVGQSVNGILLVARPDLLDKDHAKFARESLLQSGSNVLGIVINSIIPRNEKYGSYSYAKAYSSDVDSNSKKSRIARQEMV